MQIVKVGCNREHLTQLVDQFEWAEISYKLYIVILHPSTTHFVIRLGALRSSLFTHLAGSQTCRLDPTPGTLSYILTECSDLQPARQRVLSLWADHMQDKPNLMPVIMKYITHHDSSLFLQFLLDCTVLPDVRELKQQLGEWVHDSLLYLTRTFCFSVHKSRLKLLGKWNKKYWQTLKQYNYIQVRFIHILYIRLLIFIFLPLWPHTILS